MSAALRIGRVSDLDALVAIEAAAFDGDRISRRSFRRLIEARTACVMVAEQAGVVVGYAVLLFREGTKRARLYSLAVNASRSGAGMGRALLTGAESGAKARGAATLTLEVRADNARAVRLYELNGFVRFGEKTNYYEDGATALRYAKSLKEDTGSP